LAIPQETQLERVAALMERYKDHPMDLADTLGRCSAILLSVYVPGE